MILITLTLSEAASILGVGTDASKEEINTAYRAAVSKYHPDANRSKSPAEQKQAEQMFKQVGAARKVMLNPATAEPEPVNLDGSASTGSTRSAGGFSGTSNYGHSATQSTASAGSRRSGGAATSSTQGVGTRQKQSYKASASSSQYVPQGHNTASTFHDNVPKTVDPAEEQIADIYRSELRKEHMKFSDKARLTPSDGVSAAFLAIAVALMFATPFSLASITLANPLMVFALVCLGKVFVYDTFISYYARKAISKAVDKFSWGVECGAEVAIISVVALVLTLGSTFVPGFATILFGVGIAAGVAIAVLSVVLAKAKHKDNQQASR